MSQADLEISLSRRDAVGAGGSDGAYMNYDVKLRFSLPDSETEQQKAGVNSVGFDEVELRQRGLDPAAYGQYLAAQLLAEPEVRSFFDQALAVAQRADVPLRLRLNIAPRAPELHNHRWETLWLPGASAPLLTGENLLFSRYLSSLDWKPVRLRPESALRALVAVADPSDPRKHRLAPVDAVKELEAARRGLGEIAVTELATRGQVTLKNLAARLRDGYDILYLVAHGMLVDDKPWLFLEKEDGTADLVPGRELATRIQELDDRPRLAVLVSCQSAGTGQAEPTSQDEGTLAAGLGPQLAEAGVPAVIAMQGNFTMTTAAAFMPVFFAELRRDGLVDRAMALARGAVRDRPDGWMPVLFMRLRKGRFFAGVQALPPVAVPVPPAPPRLYGRSDTLDELARDIHATQFTALCGPAGVGKTALAKALANHPDVAAAFPDGRAWLELGPQANVFSALGQLLAQFDYDAGKLDDVKKRSDQLRKETARKRWLLVLDDVWRAGDARPFLDACPEPGRAVFTTHNAQIVADLKAVDREVKVLEQQAAVDMLADGGPLARQAVAADRPAAEALADLLGYLPLALHVTGRRLNQLARGPAGSAARLRDVLAEQITSVLALPAAEKWLGLEQENPSLEAVLRLSYDTLAEDARRAFRRLAVFGPQPLTFDAAAMTAVWEAQEAAAIDLQIALEEAGLLERPETTAEGVVRYGLHQVMAAFADLLAEQTGEAREARLTHASHYTTIVEGYDYADDDDPGTGRMKYSAPQEWGQVTRALDYLTRESATDDQAANKLLEYVPHWGETLRHNYDPRRRRWVDAAVDAARRLGTGEVLAKAVQLQGEVQEFEGEFDAALQSFREARSLFLKDRDRKNEIHSLKSIGHMQRLRDQLGDALETYQEALRLLGLLAEQGEPEPLSEAFVLRALGELQNLQGNHQQAYQSLQQARKLYAEGRKYVDVATVLRSLGDTLYFQGQPDAVAGFYEQALELFQEQGEPVGEAQTLASQGALSLVQGNQAAAEDLLQRAIRLCQENHARQEEAESVGKYGWFLRKAGQLDRARPYLDEAKDLWEKMDITAQVDRYRRAASSMETGANESSVVA